VKDKPTAFALATKLVADRLAYFREEGSQPTKNDLLLAGHLVGALWANDLLNTSGENWVKVEE